MIMPSLFLYLGEVRGADDDDDTETYGLVLSAFQVASTVAKPLIGRWCDTRGFREVRTATTRRSVVRDDDDARCLRGDDLSRGDRTAFSTGTPLASSRRARREVGLRANDPGRDRGQPGIRGRGPLRLARDGLRRALPRGRRYGIMRYIPLYGTLLHGMPRGRRRGEHMRRCARGGYSSW